MCLPLASAATLHGTVYDLGLDVVDNAVITVDGLQKQVVVARNGSYTITLSPGNYSLVVQRGTEVILEEDLEVAMDGDFVLDLIAIQLLDDADDEVDSRLDDISADVGDDPEQNYIVIVLLVAAIVITLILVWKHARPGRSSGQSEQNSPELPDDLHVLFDFIRAQDGRTTQKEIRLQFPYSEAKISLMLADLEAQGVIQRIKKGRGNIIILKKTNTISE
ncbi:hypothetical protein HY490_02175 [Candidatus Woesearchaeota archaeon]|nr:hypothetical protein [Candidatus Woesearchaeota archaeon]